jgi:hypothetical protein
MCGGDKVSKVSKVHVRTTTGFTCVSQRYLSSTICDMLLTASEDQRLAIASYWEVSVAFLRLDHFPSAKRTPIDKGDFWN